MKHFNPDDLKNLYVPPSGSHKGQNGKLLIIGGSHLFHAASLWALQIASRVVDMVFYSSVPENYIEEADAVLIGPGMLRVESEESRVKKQEARTLGEINKLDDEGLQSYY